VGILRLANAEKRFMEAVILNVLLGVAVTLMSYGYMTYMTRRKRRRAARRASLIHLKAYRDDREVS
jgi:cbb3-type cytochrome oxidase subunit 3